VGGHPRVVAQLETMALGHRERAVLVEHGVDAGRARAALQPQHDGCVRGAAHCREEPEEHVGTMLLVHSQVTGVALDGRLQGFHLARGPCLVDLACLYQGRQVQSPIATAATATGCHRHGCPTADEQAEDGGQHRRR